MNGEDKVDNYSATTPPQKDGAEALEQIGSPLVGEEAAAQKRKAREEKMAEANQRMEEKRAQAAASRAVRELEREKARAERAANRESGKSTPRAVPSPMEQSNLPETGQPNLVSGSNEGEQIDSDTKEVDDAIPPKNPSAPKRRFESKIVDHPAPEGISKDAIDKIIKENDPEEVKRRIKEAEEKANELTGKGLTKTKPVRSPRTAGSDDIEPAPSPFKDIEDHLEIRVEHYPEYEPILELVREQSDHGKARLSAAVIGADAELLDTVFRGLCGLESIAPELYWRHSGMETRLVIQLPGENRTVALDDDKHEFTIGRPSSGQNPPDIPINEPYISRQHARLINTADHGLPPEWMLEDTNSQHGVKLDGVPLSGSADWDYEVPAVLGYRHVADKHGRAAIHPVLTLRRNSRIISDEFIGRLKRDCDLLFLVVNGDFPTKNDHNALHWVSEQMTKGVVVIAVTSGRLNDEEQAVVLDDLRHDARIVRGTKQVRTLVECRQSHIDEIEADLATFLDQFRANMQAAVLDDRIRDSRRSLLHRIGKVNESLRPDVETELNLLRRKLDETEHRLLGTVSSVTEAKSLFESVSTNLEKDLDRAVNQFGDSTIVASLASNTDQFIDRLEIITHGKSPVTIKLVPPGNPNATAVETHRAIMDSVVLPQAQQKFGSELYNRVFGDTGGSPMAHETQVGYRWLYQQFQALLSGLPKYDSSQIKVANYEDKILGVRGEISATVTDKYVMATISTEEKMDNMFTYLLTKTRYSMTFFFSMFSIGALVVGVSRSVLIKDLRATMTPVLWFGGAAVAIPLIIYFNYKAFKLKQKDVISEEGEKIRDGIKKHYQGIVKRVIADCEQIFDNHMDALKRHTKTQLDGLAVARGLGGDDALLVKNPELKQIRDAIDEKVSELAAFQKEREWVDQARENPCPSPLVPEANPRPRFGSRPR